MKKYKIALIYNHRISDIPYFTSSNYNEAYTESIRRMKNDPDIVSCLIYSNKGSALVLKRKWVDDINLQR